MEMIVIHWIILNVQTMMLTPVKIVHPVYMIRQMMVMIMMVMVSVMQVMMMMMMMDV